MIRGEKKELANKKTSFLFTFTTDYVSGPPYSLQLLLVFLEAMFGLQVTGLLATPHHNELSPNKKKTEGLRFGTIFNSHSYFRSIIIF